MLDKLSVEKGNVRSGASGEDGAAINTDPRSQTHPRAPTARRTHLSPIPGSGDLLPTVPMAAGPQCTWGPIYVNVDSPNLGFPYFNFLGGVPVKKLRSSEKLI